MSVKNQILDGLGQGYTAQVGSNNALLVQVVPETSKGVPPADLSNLRLLQEFFVNSLGSEQQTVNGSVTPVEFSVTASSSITKWITGFRMNLEMTDALIATNQFRRYGPVVAPGLTNGVRVYAVQSGVTTNITSQPVQNIGDYLNYSTPIYLNFQDAIAVNVDYLQLNFEFATPIVLPSGSTDRVSVLIQDDLSIAGFTSQVAIAFGYQEFS